MAVNQNSEFNYALDEAMRLHNQGQIEKAVSQYQNLLEKYPDSPDLWHLLGIAAHQKRQHALAEQLIKTALSLNETIPDFHTNLGLVYRALNRDQDAEQSFRYAIHLDPEDSKSLTQLASLFREKQDYTAAINYARQAVRANPKNADALNNLGNVEKDSALTKEAVKSYRQAIETRPDFALAHWNLALALLSLGEMSEGFSEMAWRWKWDKFPGIRRNFSQPNWNGEDLSNSVIYLHPEQGLGDTILFMRYAPLIKQLAEFVYLELPPAIAPLVENPNFADQIIIQGEKIPEFDYHVPFMDLPRILKTAHDNIPSDIPYLKIDEKLKTRWQNWKKQYEGIRIGINWSGNKTNPAEILRGIPPDVLTPLSRIAGITWFNLQKGDDSNRVGQLSKKFKLIETGPAPLEETAALISELDLVITTDTAVAHLSGALGKTVWILLHHAPDWRWLTAGETSQWYPSAKLFRQSSPGNWGEVIENVYQDLLAFTP